MGKNMTSRQLSIDEAANSTWGAIVIGAGPAGALSALLLARSGIATLLIERKPFPRDKICGGCLNHRGIAVLERAGLRHVLQGNATSALDRIEIRGRNHRLTCDVKGSLAILRSELDERLAIAAMASGVRFLPNTNAQVQPGYSAGEQTVCLADRQGRKVVARANVVLACDGLNGGSLTELDQFVQHISPRSRIGAGAILKVDDPTVQSNCLHMAIGRSGYVGRMQLGDGRICLGAALDRHAVSKFGVGGAISRILGDCNIDADSLYTAFRIQGTVPLTRRPRSTSDGNIFLVGDACGYIEPFSGEGMALALETAEAVVPLATKAIAGSHRGLDHEWARTIHRIAFRRRAVCRCLSLICRWPGLVDLTLAAAHRVPRLMQSILGQINYLNYETQSVTTWHSN